MDTGKPGGKRPLAIKVYVVMQRINIAHGDELNSRIIAARLTSAAADDIVKENPGTWVEKHVAVK